LTAQWLWALGQVVLQVALAPSEVEAADTVAMVVVPDAPVPEPDKLLV
jgi:hypothetical protein